MSKENKNQPTNASNHDSDNKQTRYCDVMSGQPIRTRHAVLLGIVRGVLMLKVKRGQTESFWQKVKDHAQKLKLPLPQTSSKLSFIKNMYWLDEEKECQKLNKKLFCSILMAAEVDQQCAAAEWDAVFKGTPLPEDAQQTLPILDTTSGGDCAEQQDQSMEDLDQQIKVVRHHQAGLEEMKDEIIKRLDGLEDHLQGLQQRVLGNEFHQDQLVTELRRVLPTAGIFEIGVEATNDHV